MHALLAPVLAQVLTVGVADRVEGDYIATPQTNANDAAGQGAPGVAGQYNTFESRNTVTPAVGVTFDRGRASFRFGYAPSLSVVPLEEKPRDVFLYHVGFVDGGYRWRSTKLSISETIGYGERDFQRDALLGGQPQQQGQTQPTGGQQTGTANPGTGGTGTPTQGGTGGTGTPAPGGTGTPTQGGNGTPTQGTGNTTPALAGPSTYASFRTLASIDHIVSRPLSWRVAAGYTISGGMGRVSQRSYPLARGPDGTLSVRLAVDTRNVLTSTLTAQLVYDEAGGNAFVASAGEDYFHSFTRETYGLFGAGVSFSRAQPPPPEKTGRLYSLPQYSIYPTARASLSHRKPLDKHTTLLLGVGTNVAPVLDTTTVSVDPRVGGNVLAGMSYRRFALNASGSTALSLTPKSPTAFDSFAASLIATQGIVPGITLDGGVRSVWQQYGGTTLILPSYIVFVGLNVGLATPLNPPRHP